MAEETRRPPRRDYPDRPSRATPAQRALGLLALGSLAAAALLVVLIWQTEAALRRVTGPATTVAAGPAADEGQQVQRIATAVAAETRVSPHGTVDWAMAFSNVSAASLLETWTEELGRVELRRVVDQGLVLDRWLICAYVIGLMALCLLAAPAFPAKERLLWLFVCALPPLAGLLDWFENDLLDQQLDMFEKTASGVQWALPTSLAAVIKFGLLATTLLALIVVGVAWLGKRGAVPRTAIRFRQDDVSAAERRYLGQRRDLLGLDRSHDIGLALSGGGLRSATINLGALQALARHRVLPQFDYLSTVSGGGYIGAAVSSLLSINGSEISSAPTGRERQYEFAPGDKPWFSTAPERFPFGPENEAALRRDGGFGGASQLRHLRAAGEFLVGKRQPLSIEMLRVVGGVLGGIFYHLLHFGLFMVSLSAGYLWAIYLMVGDWATRNPPRNLLPTSDESAGAFGLFDQYKLFVKETFGFGHVGPWWTHPFFIAAVVGFAAMAIILNLWPRLLGRLRDDWFLRPGDTPAGSRNLVAVFAMIGSMMALGFLVLTTWFAMQNREALLNMSIPLFSYLGGGACLGIGHGWVKIRRKFGRTDRSRLAAQEGAFVYLTLISLILVLLIMPFLVFFEPLMDYLSERPVRSLFGWLLTLLGARAFAGGASQTENTGLLGRLFGLFPGLHKVLLSSLVVLAVLGGLLQICVLIWRFDSATAPGVARFLVSAVALGLFVLTGWLDFDRLALSFFYRDRLAEAYLRTSEIDENACNSLHPLRDSEAMRLQDLHGRKESGQPEDCVTAAPYHLAVTCLNLAGANRHDRQATRKTDQFIFSKLFCGSERCGFLPTAEYRRGETRLAAAMTISGAAASPAMGERTFFAQSAAMTLLNVRLGRWMENPSFCGGTEPKRTFWPPYLLREIFATGDVDQRLVYLSDGGHSGDNLGIYPLLRRRCRLIVAVDAEYDPLCSGDSLVEALRQIWIDESIKVDIDLAPLRPNPDTGLSRAHYVCGRINYPDHGAPGWLVVLKSTLGGDESEMIANYKRINKAFPHQTTGDLFFDDAQFEAYRQLGEHMVDTLLDTSTICRGELTAVPATP